MGEEAKMADYCSGDGAEEDDREHEWEFGLPDGDDLMPLSLGLVPPELATAFNIKPEPYRTLGDVNRASQRTLSSIRRQSPGLEQENFKEYGEDNSPEEVILEDNDEDRTDSRKIQRVESAEETDFLLRVENSNSVDEQSAKTVKRPRLVWTPQLHKRFVDVVAHLGIKNAVPKTIMQLMNVEGLTRENVASHLQKYRLYLKRMHGLSMEGPSSSDPLFATTPVQQSLNDGSSNNGNGHMPMPPIPMPYGMMPMPMHVMSHHHHGGVNHGRGHVGMHMGNFNRFESSHHGHPQHAYSMMQQRDWPGNKGAS